jgi:hypothetical protein
MSNNVITVRHRNVFSFGFTLCFMIVTLHFIPYVSNIVSFWHLLVYLSIYSLLLSVILCQICTHFFYILPYN